MLAGILGAVVVLVICGWALTEYVSSTRNHRRGGGSAAKPVTKPSSGVVSEPPVIKADASGALVCQADDAVVSGDVEIVSGTSEKALRGWNTLDSEARWTLAVARPGFYQAEVVYAATAAAEESAIEVQAGDRRRSLSLRPSGSLDSFHSDTVTVALNRTGRQELSIRPRQMQPGDWLHIQSVRLVPIAPNVGP
jgi:hypothetical protein